jgi:hypothetical protein
MMGLTSEADRVCATGVSPVTHVYAFVPIWSGRQQKYPWPGLELASRHIDHESSAHRGDAW